MRFRYRASGSTYKGTAVKLLTEGAATITLFGTMSGVEDRLPRHGVPNQWTAVGRYMRQAMNAPREREAS